MTSAATAPNEPPRHCIKCGREIGPDQTICEFCNRAGMATPSASQYHATVAVAIVAAVAALAVAASLSLRGVGPYVAEVTAVEPAAPGYDVTVRVRNDGTREGRAQCQLVALGDSGQRLRTSTLLTPRIAGGDEATVVESIPGLTELPAEVTVSCS